jgi:hypothetical protein
MTGTISREEHDYLIKSNTMVIASCGVALSVATYLFGMYLAAPPRAPIKNIVGVEAELKRCVVVLNDTQRSVDFWREQALAMRTNGIDAPERKVPEGDTPRKEGR